jgi:uncharacterized protein
MDWVDALFLHWPIDPVQLRARIPADLDIDTFDGTAWVSIVAFRIAGARLRGVPARAAWLTFPEVNVRTYVRHAEHVGVWFVSLDADSRAAVAAGRRIVHFPYTAASISFASNGADLAYDVRRTGRRAPDARFSVHASRGIEMRSAVPGTLAHWLVERRCFFTTTRRGLTVRGDIEHEPWPLSGTVATITENSLLRAADLTPSTAEPITHVSLGVTTHASPLR